VIRAVATVLEADSLRLRLDVPGWPGQRPGQFAMLSLDPSGLRRDPLLPRPMAVFESSGDQVEFRFKIVGRGTALMARLRPDDTLGVVGPLGNGFSQPRARVHLVGGGTGIASLYELAQQLAGFEHGGRVLLGGRSARDVLALESFRATGAPLDIATDDGSLGHRGLVTDLLDPAPGDEVLACGPTPMMRRAHEIARKAGASCRVSLENQMACGFGVCLGCAVSLGERFRYVCTDGPVFDADTLDWDAIA